MIQGRNQRKVIAFLSNPSSYPGQLNSVERFETHGAVVFLAGAEAWKIKRAVRFPYMDFSTLERRQIAILRELEINQRLAPEIYIGVAPITRNKLGKLQFGSNGDTVEWALRMRRFDQSALLSHVVESGSLSTDLAIALADAVFESHQTAVVFRPGAAGAERVQHLISLVSTTLSTVRDVFDGAKLQCFSGRAADQLDQVKAVLNTRAAAGFVRRCHGDLHLNNIVLWHDLPVLFDAIEFDEELATIDTLYDLAFLLMDLDRCGQRNLANIVLNRYLWRSGADLDYEGMEALPLFLGLRAAIRAMVTAERAQQRPADAARDRLTGAEYLDAANTYLVPAAPRLIAVGGLSGTGKSTLARALAPELGAAPGAVHLRSDLERKRLHRVAETIRLGPDAYSRAAGEAVYAVLYAKARKILAAGHAVIVDGVFAKPEERRRIEAVAIELTVPFQGLWLTGPPERLVERVARTSR